MKIFALGINHKTAPIEVREKFCLNTTEKELLLSELKNDPSVVEALVLSTCNRTEIYAHIIDDNPGLLLRTLFEIKEMPCHSDAARNFYVYEGREAIKHLFGVAAGLDSLILGEKQILGQVKAAIEISRKKNMLGKYFNILLNMAVRAGKKARTETQIDFGGSSVSWAAVKMAQEVLGTLENKSVLVMGAGKMGKLTTGHLDQKGIKHFYIMNRSREKADALAEQFKAEAVSFWDLEAILEEVDVCICSADAPHYLIDQDVVKKALDARKTRKLVLIDISVPRNIDPRVRDLDNIILITIDDLDKVVEKSIQKRQASVCLVQDLIEKKIEELFAKWAKVRMVESTGCYYCVP